MRIFAALALCLSTIIAPLSASAQDAGEETENSALNNRAEDVVKVFQGSLAAEDIFNDVFLAAVSPAQLAAMNAQLEDQFGAILGVESVEPTGANSANVSFRFERAIGRGMMVIESAEPHLVAGLRLASFDPVGDSLENIQADLEALPGEVSVYFGPLDGENSIVSINPDQHFAIGSTFKLYVLSALGGDIASGKRQWEDVVYLDKESFPSGIAQDWPLGSPVTLHTLATLMISISDNTATDQLIDVLGRDAVEAELRASGHSEPARTLPFLTTLEMFALKDSDGNTRKYLEADETGRRAILADFQDDTGGISSKVEFEMFTEPTHIDTLEWFASANDLRRLFTRMRVHDDDTAFQIMKINTSMPANLRNNWSYVGYKGGSEPGVLNLTWLMTDNTGTDHILTLSWNNPDASLDNTALELIAQRIIALPR